MQRARPEVIGIIPARYGSSRFPGKLLTSILGKPLIQRTYENALRSKKITELVVATDDQRIFDTVKDFGGKVVMTYSDHSTGTERVAEAYSTHFSNYSLIINIQGDEPCINPHTIDATILILEDNNEAHMSTAVTSINDPALLLDRNVVKCVMTPKGKALYFSRAPIPTPYRHIGIYCFWKSSLLKFAKLSPTPQQQAEDLEQLKALENDFSIYCAKVEEKGKGVDVPEDVKKVEKIICQENISSLQEVSSLP